MPIRRRAATRAPAVAAPRQSITRVGGRTRRTTRPHVRSPGSASSAVGADYVHVHDVAHALLAAIGQAGVFNISTGIETAVSEIFGLLRVAAKVIIEGQLAPLRAGTGAQLPRPAPRPRTARLAGPGRVGGWLAGTHQALVREFESDDSLATGQRAQNPSQRRIRRVVRSTRTPFGSTSRGSANRSPQAAFSCCRAGSSSRERRRPKRSRRIVFKTRQPSGIARNFASP